MKEVLEYIEYLKSKIDHEPQCFMVSMLIKAKFTEAEHYYNNNHFITKIGDHYYDWDGLAEKTDRYSIFPEEWGDNWIVIHYDAIKDHFKEFVK